MCGRLFAPLERNLLRRSVRLLAAFALVALACLAIAAPAAGATLPAGQRIPVMDPVTGDVYTADPATAALTLVATGS